MASSSWHEEAWLQRHVNELNPRPHNVEKSPENNAVTLRAFAVGLLVAIGMAALNCWIETVANVHFIGGVQMPFGAVFGLLFFIVGINAPLARLHRLVPFTRRSLPLFSPTELLTIYSMLLPATMISTPGTDNFFITVGPALFYFSTHENGWADLFYQHIPSWFAPGWDGATYQREVIEPLYSGGLSLAQIPWHAWTAMILAWSIFLLLVYGTLFFVALLFRRQWIENEALAFPLIQLPLQMVEIDEAGAHPPARAFWGNRVMWMGFALAASFHLLRGLNNFYPDWPLVPAFQGNALLIEFPDQPWNAMGPVKAELYMGAIGLAYLLSRELVFSFWFFYFLGKLQPVFAQMLGFPPVAIARGAYSGLPHMTHYQSVGAWVMLGLWLIWTARHHLIQMGREALAPDAASHASHTEPFAPRFVVLGLLFCLVGLLAWSWFAGINILVALSFFGIYLLGSLVLARLVIEGGFLFPQLGFASLELMASGLFGTSALGAGNLARLSFLQSVIMTDMRTNTLPAFLHTLKLAHEQKMSKNNVRRLLGASVVAVVATLAVTTFTSIVTLYAAGGLSGYTYFTVSGAQVPLKGVAAILKTQPGIEPANWLWTGVGALAVYGLMLARSRFLWFPLHPLGYLAAFSYGLSKLWLSFFIGWAAKTLIMRFGGSATYLKVRPFMIGLILGNLASMVLWMLLGFRLGSQIPYWPA